MILGLGPVLRYELITTSRRGRYFIGRTLYGLLLLYLLANEYLMWEMQHPGGGTMEQIRAFAEATFIQFGYVQGVVLLCLIPALVAGVIADEHQRKTLHYLLASRLSSAEIVLGKLGARLVHIGVFLALGLPEVCLLALYGGLNPQNVAWVYGSTFTAVFFLAGLSILISTLASCSRDAIVVTYGLTFLWLVVPPFLRPFVMYIGWPLGWVKPLNDLALAINPLYVWNWMTQIQGSGNSWWGGNSYYTTMVEEALPLMVGLQAGLGLLFVILAIVGLRPLRGSSWPGGEPRVGWFARLATRLRAALNAHAAAALTRNPVMRSARSRPSCGDQPMFWKERYTSLGGGLSWLGSRPVVLVMAVLLGCYLFDTAWPFLTSGRWFGSSSAGRNQFMLNRELSVVTQLLLFLGMLTVGASGAVSITGERENDTWISLSVTMVRPREVILAKEFGAVWSARWLGLAILTLWVAGLSLGVFHPLGVLGAATSSIAAAWSIAALGVFCSQRARNSTRALMMTIIGMLVLLAWWIPGLISVLLGLGVEFKELPAGYAVKDLDLDPPKLIRAFQMITLVALGTWILTLLATRRLRLNWN